MNALEDPSPIRPRGQVPERAEGAVDEAGRLIQLEVAHVGLAQLDVDTGPGDALACLREHRGRLVDSDHAAAGLAGDGDRDSPVADRQLDERPLALAGELDVEGNVRRHVRRPVVVDRRERFVNAHEADGIVARWTPRRSRAKHGPRSPRPPILTRSKSFAFAISAARAR